MTNEEMYFKKSELSVLFTETLKSHPDQKAMLMELWNNVKSLKVESMVERQCKGECESCPVKTQCKSLEECKALVEKFHEVQETDSYWSDLAKSTGLLLAKNKDSKLAQTIVHSTLEDLSEFSKTLPEYKKWLQEIEQQGG